MEIRKIQENELIEAKNISSVCFNWAWSEEKSDEEWMKEIREHPNSKANAYYQDTWAAFSDKGEMMAAISVIPYQVYFDGQKAGMAGIGGVCTYPQFRRSGSIRGMFEKILPQLYEEGCLFSYLYPFSEAFYRKFGYERSGQNRVWQLDLKTIPDFDYQALGEMKLCRSEEEYEPLKAAYEVFAAAHNLCVSRDTYDWDSFRDTNPFLNNRYLYYFLRQTEEGGKECGGYLLFEDAKKDGERGMECRELVYRDFPALQSLLAFARGFSGSYDFIRFSMPAFCNLDFFIPDYAKSQSHSADVSCLGMVRAVSVEKILWAARYEGNGELSFRLSDSVVEGNNRIFRLRYQNGRAVEVLVQKPEAPEGGAAVDMELPVNLFSSAIVGSLSAAELKYRPEVKWGCEPEKAAGVFYRKSNWIHNYF